MENLYFINNIFILLFHF